MNATFSNLQQRAKSIINQNGLTHIPTNLCFEHIAQIWSGLQSDVFRFVRSNSGCIVDTPTGYKTIHSDVITILVSDGSRISIRPTEKGVEISGIISYNAGIGRSLMLMFLDAYFQTIATLGKTNPECNDFVVTLDCCGHITDTLKDKEIFTDIKRQVKFFTQFGFRKSNGGSMTKAYEQRYVPMMLDFNDDFKKVLATLNDIHKAGR